MIELFAGILLYCQSHTCLISPTAHSITIVACTDELGASSMSFGRSYIRDGAGVITLAVYYQRCPIL